MKVYKPIIRMTIIAMVVFWFIVLASNNFSFKPEWSIYCPEDTKGTCVNPYYVCKHHADGWAEYPCEAMNKIDMPVEAYERYYLYAGERIGKEEPALVKYGNIIVLCILITGLIINYGWYRWKLR